MQSCNENIRPPDEVKIIKLQEDTMSDFEKQMEKAMHCSLQEQEEQEEINKNYEDKLINDYLSETKVRRDKFENFLFDLIKLIKYDTDIKEIYDIIEPIIDSYCYQYIQNCELDEITYDRIFKVIGTIRTDKKNVELLKTILIKI